jgi:penicillin-binding protein 1A
MLLNRIIRIFWVLFVLGLLAVVAVFTLITTGRIGYMPPIEELENPKNTIATEVYSADGTVLNTFYHRNTGNRVLIGYEDLSADLIHALIATEDARFVSHSGIDLKALFRAVIKRGILMNKQAGGGSTLTQQLAKQLWTPRAESVTERLMQKPIEWVIAVKLERFYTKEDILTMYLNQYDFANNAVGIKNASMVYFGTTPSALKIEEAALLVGMCKNSALYNPLRFPERSHQRRNVVLAQMRKAGYLSAEQTDSLQALPLELDYRRVDHKLGLAPYFREYLRQTLTHTKPDRKKYASWQDQQFRDDSLSWETNPLYGWCVKNLKEDGSPYNLYTDGLKIYTTIDSRMQQYAEEAVHEHVGEYLQQLFYKEKRGRSYAPFTRHLTPEQLEGILNRSVRQSERYRVLKLDGMSDEEIRATFHKPTEMTVFTYEGMKDTVMTPMDSIKYHKFFLRAGFMAMDPLNGHVKAYVGGVSFRPFQYDMVMQGRRQVGSTIKPLLYTMAMEEGYSPCDPVVNEPVTIITETGQAWTPRNVGGSRIGEVVTLRWGMANSNNWISAYVMSHFSPYTFVRLLRSFGLNGSLDPVVSLAVGACEATVAEMVSAYSSFANRGIRVQPLLVTRIEDKNGNELAHFSPQMHEVFSETTSYKMLSMVRAVVDQGTGIRLRYRYQLKAEMGGKTGTTQNNSDGWFMGITPRLVGGVWVGGEERDIHFDYTSEGQGANMSLPVWALFMKKVYAHSELGYSESDSFEVPEGQQYTCSKEDIAEPDQTEAGYSVFDHL